MVRFSRVALVAPLPMCSPVRSCLTCHETRWGPLAEISTETRWDQGVTTKSGGIWRFQGLFEILIVFTIEFQFLRQVYDMDAVLFLKRQGVICVGKEYIPRSPL